MIKLIKAIEKFRLYISELFDRLYWYLDGLKYPPQPEGANAEERPLTKEELINCIEQASDDLYLSRTRLAQEHQETISRFCEDYAERRQALEEWYIEYYKDKYQLALKLGYILEGESLCDLIGLPSA